MAEETRLRDPLGLVPLIEVRGTADSVPELAETALVMVELVPLLLTTLVTTLDESSELDAVVEAMIDEATDEAAEEAADEAAADELDEEESSTKVATMRISWHCPPIDSS